MGLALMTSWIFGVVFNWGLIGIWMGPAVSRLFNFFAYQFIFARLDWDSLISQSQIQRINDLGEKEE